MGKLNIKHQIQDILDRVELDDQLLAELKELQAKADEFENKVTEKLDAAEAKVDSITDKVKACIQRLRATLGFWSIIEMGALLFMVIPAIEGDYNVAFTASIAYILMHKFNVNWLK
jgi:ABC-type Fe3+-hydroxamate transport system substrate-binding protein